LNAFLTTAGEAAAVVGPVELEFEERESLERGEGEDRKRYLRFFWRKTGYTRQYSEGKQREWEWRRRV